MFVVFDLDGTLADCTHREHFLRRPVGQKDWEGFHKAAAEDPPKEAIVHTLFGLSDNGHKIEIWTGRDEQYREKTKEWLWRHRIEYAALIMRPIGDKTEDQILKRQWAEKYGKPDLVFEDRRRVVDMWRSIVVTCCQVAPGDF